MGKKGSLRAKLYSSSNQENVIRAVAYLGKKLKHEKLEETKHGLFRDCFLGAPE